MANARGAILTDRDRVLLTFVGVARYVSAEQVHRLFFEGSSKVTVHGIDRGSGV